MSITKENMEMLKIKSEIENPIDSVIPIVLLSIFGGVFGMHRFAVKDYKVGGAFLGVLILTFILIEILRSPVFFFIFPLLALAGLVDGVFILRKKLKEKQLEQERNRIYSIKKELKGKHVIEEYPTKYLQDIQNIIESKKNKLKDKKIASLLLIFGWIFGIHRFYIGDIKKGLFILFTAISLKITGSFFGEQEGYLFYLSGMCNFLFIALYFYELFVINKVVELKNKTISIRKFNQLKALKKKRISERKKNQ